MSQPESDLPDSLIGPAAGKVARIARAMERVGAAIGIELIDFDLDPGYLTDERRAELAALSTGLIKAMQGGFDILRNVAETGAINLELDSHGLPIAALAAGELPALAAGDQVPTEPSAAEPATPAASATARPPRAKGEKVYQDIKIVANGLRQTPQELGLTNPYGAYILRTLPELEPRKPFANGDIVSRPDFAPDLTAWDRSHAFSEAMRELRAMRTPLDLPFFRKHGVAKGTEYEILETFVVDGKLVESTDPRLLKKK